MQFKARESGRAAREDEPAIEVRDLTVTFGDVRAVDGVSFVLRRGHTLGLLGRNGAGKTTIISALLGLVLPSGGTVHAFGSDMVKHRHRALGLMNYSSPYSSFPARLSVYQVLRFYGGLYDVRRLDNVIRTLARQLEINDLLGRFFGDLSAGQKTRVSLAKALLNGPQLLLLDEPTASLDPESEEWALDVIETYRSRSGCAILIASHNMDEVQRLCTEAMVLDGGRIIEQGTTGSLLEKYDEESLRPVFLEIVSET